MSKIKVTLRPSGVRQLLKSREVADLCMEHAQRVQARAGEHYAAEARKYPERSGAAVFPQDAEGYYDNLSNNTLLRSLK